MTTTKTGTASDVPSGVGAGSLNADGSFIPSAPPAEAFIPPLSVASTAEATSPDYWNRLESFVRDPQHSTFLLYLDRIDPEAAAPARAALAAADAAAHKVRDLADKGTALLDQMEEERAAAAEAAADAILQAKKAPAPFDVAGWTVAMTRLASKAGPAVGEANAAVSALDAELLALGPVVRDLIVADLRANAEAGRAAAATAAECVGRDEALRALLDLADLSDYGVHLGEMAQRRRNALKGTDGYRADVRKEGGHLNAPNILRDVLTSEATVDALASWKPGDTA